MAIPDFQTLMLPVLKLGALGDIEIKDAIARLAGQFELSQEERSLLNPASSNTVFGNRVHWAKTFLKAAGLVEQPKRAWFRSTQRGREVLSANPDRIDVKFLMQFPEFRDFRTRSRRATGETGVSGGIDMVGEQSEVLTGPTNPDEAIAQAYASLTALLTTELLAKLRALSPAGFEKLVIELLLAMGYGGSRREAARALGRSGDDGVDGVVDEDALGLDRIFVQAKRYAAGNDVGPAAIREFFGSLNLKKASKGLFVTTSAFSRAARETAEQLGTRIVLIDGEQLAALMIRFGVGCRVVERIEIKRLDEDFFEDLDT